MAVERNVIAVSLLSLACFLVLGVACVVLGTITTRLKERQTQIEIDVESTKQRIADLEEENDYLFEEKESGLKVSVRQAKITHIFIGVTWLY